MPPPHPKSFCLKLNHVLFSYYSLVFFYDFSGVSIFTALYRTRGAGRNHGELLRQELHKVVQQSQQQETPDHGMMWAEKDKGRIRRHWMT